MKGAPKTRIEKRLEEIERDLQRARKTERALRAGRLNPEAVARPAPPAPLPAPAPERPKPVEPAAPAPQAPLFPPTVADPDLFSHATQRRAAPEPPAGEHRRRFANYLTSGGLMGVQPLRQDRTQIRNRAIVMIIVVILMAYSLYRFFFRSRPAPEPVRPAPESLY